MRNAGKFLFVLALVISVAGLSAQTTTQKPKPYEPQVSQGGKDVVWVPTPQELVEKMLDLAKLTPNDFLMDLGSGDGRTVITAAKRGATALGIEYNPDMVELSTKNAAAEGVSAKAKFTKADIFQTDFSKATVLTLFLLPDLNVRLRPTSLDMKPGTRIVSNTFTMGDWAADESSTVSTNCSTYCTAHLWIVPAKVQGSWKLPQGELKLTQTYQNFTGTLGSTAISNGKLVGEKMTFEAGGSRYEGTVNGNRIQGTVRAGNNSTPFTATR